jgi:RimJ/RimL family protein N-acetyltransferase
VGLLPLTTERLTLRRFRPDDAPVLAAYRSDPDVARYQGWALPFTVDHAAALIGEQSELDGPTRGEWIQIAVDHDGTLVGDVAVGLSADGDVADIGYSLIRAHQGHGYAREAVAAVVEALFAVVRVRRVQAGTDPRNARSIHLLESLGFDHEATLPQVELVRGELVDDARFALERP